MILLFATAILTVADPSADLLKETSQAIESNRLVQAGQMVADAIASGEEGPVIDQLLADLAFADQRWSEARDRYMMLLHLNPAEARTAERAAIASMTLGDRESARALIERAISSEKPSWRAWNILGVLCDLEKDWDCADAAYATADELSDGRAEVLNNHGWSLILRGEWAIATNVLIRSSQVDPTSSRIRNNLELAAAAVAADLPRRRQGESNIEFAARLNDLGVVAEQQGNRDRAVAAFSQAIAVSTSWYERAANNLARLQPE